MADEGKYVESAGQRYRVATLVDFKDFRDAVSTTEGWQQKYHSDTVQCYTKSAPAGSEGAGLNIYKVVADFPTLAGKTMYDTLHDPEYRAVWDGNMIVGNNMCQLDERNDIGYYACNMPWPLAKRDFLNLRSWMEFTNGEFIIMNYSVSHADCPVDKKYVRGVSYRTGYYITPLPGAATGVRLLYMAHSDPKGSIPHMVINTAMTKLAPTMIRKIEDNASKYPEWAAKHYKAGTAHPWATAAMSWDGEEMAEALPAKEQPALPPAAAPDTAPAPPNRTVSLLGNPAVGPAINTATPEEAGPVAALQQQVAELQQQLLASRDGGAALDVAPVAPRRAEDGVAVQQYRALMQDAACAVDRQYQQEGRAPPLQEYLTRLRVHIEGMRRTLPAR